MKRALTLFTAAILCHLSTANANLPKIERIPDDALLASIKLIREARAEGKLNTCDERCIRQFQANAVMGMFVGGAVLWIANEAAMDSSRRLVRTSIGYTIHSLAGQFTRTLAIGAVSGGLVGMVVVMAAVIVENLPASTPTSDISISDSILSSRDNMNRFLDLDEKSMLQIARNEPKLAAHLVVTADKILTQKH